VKRVAVLAAMCALAGLAASPAFATRECKGFQTCVPIGGPWVVANTLARVQYQLECPKSFIVGGLDAEVSNRAVDVGFVGALGSPVNPGITTSKSALFLGRLVRGRDPVASFRPHIGCIPASGGGQRVPTARRAQTPVKESAVESTQFTITPGTYRYVAACARGERAISYTHALGFYAPQPPTLALVRAVHVGYAFRAGKVRVTVSGTQLAASTNAVVQIDLLCVAK
jgi:hypothetical protein